MANKKYVPGTLVPQVLIEEFADKLIDSMGIDSVSMKQCMDLDENTHTLVLSWVLDIDKEED